MKDTIGKIIISEEKDILRVRQAVKSVTKGMDFHYMDCIRVATAASELTRNLYEHASGGTISIYAVKNRGRSGLGMVFTDKGGGIKNLDEIMDGDYKSKAGLGIGLMGSKALMDDFEIQTELGKGTTVTITKWLPLNIPVTPPQINKIKLAIAEISEETALEGLKSQNRELIEVLDELKKKNAEIKETNRELETTNAGIISLYQEIDKKNEELDLKNRHKTEFLRSLGHETRTPINSIITLAGILKKRIDGDLTPEQEKQVTMISESAGHMLSLVNDLLDLSRIEAGMIDINMTVFPVKDLFHLVSSTIKPLADEKGLKLEFTSGKAMPLLKSDIKLLLQVLLNLLGNAVKFTDKGSLQVTVKRLQGAEARGQKPDKSPSLGKKGNEGFSDQITIEVKDTGIGIPEDKLDIIFKEFKQVHSREDIPRGSGLGLPIARRIVETLGGTISVKSKEGRGSTFTLTLPVESAAAQLTEPPPVTDEITIEKETILIIEDDENMIYNLKKSLEKRGYSTLIARTPEKALKLAAIHPLFAVCLDIMLPKEEDGWNTLKALKRNPNTRNIPVLVMTVLQGMGDKALVLGANEFLAKPIDWDRLHQILNQYHKLMRLETILVVDDEQAELTGFSSYFGNKYTVLTAHDGKEATEVMQDNDPDLIMLDIVMPVMDGFEFLQWLRSNERHKNIPVIVYTSKDLSRDEMNILASQTSALVKKEEESIEELSDRVGHFFGTI